MPTRQEIEAGIVSDLTAIVDIPNHINSMGRVLDYTDQEVARVEDIAEQWSAEKGLYYMKTQMDIYLLGKSNIGHTHSISDVTNLSSTLALKADLVAGKIPESQLPSYVDDVLEFDDLESFPTTGSTGVIYVDKDENKTYRWSGSTYVSIGSGAPVSGSPNYIQNQNADAQINSNFWIDGSATIEGTVKLTGLEDSATSKLIYFDESTGVLTYGDFPGLDGTLTAGRVPFASDSDTLTDSDKLTWDNTNGLLSIGSGSSTSSIVIPNNKSYSALTTGAAVTRLLHLAADNGVYIGGIDASASGAVRIRQGGTDRITINSSGHVGIGKTPSVALDINGGADSNATTVLKLATGDGTRNASLILGAGDNLIFRNSHASSAAAGFDFQNRLSASFLRLNTTTGVVFNEGGADHDFRIEGDTDTHLIFADAGLEKVGIGLDSPDEKLHVNGSIKAGITGTVGGKLKLAGSTSGVVTIQPNDNSINWTFKLPSAAPSDDGYYLTGNSDGTSEWSAAPTTVNVDTGSTSVYTGSLNSPMVDGSIMIGNNAGLLATGATQSIIIGGTAGYEAINAISMVAIGGQAGYQAQNAYYSVFLGQDAGYLANEAPYSVMLGAGTGVNALNATGSVFLGKQTGYGAQNAAHSIFLGTESGYLGTNASDSIFIGRESGRDATNATHVTAIGHMAGKESTDSSFSEFIGYQAGKGNTLANNSIFIGMNAGNEEGLTTGYTNNGNNDYSILLGRFTRTGGYKNSIILGGSVDGEYISNTADNQLMIAPNIEYLSLCGVEYELPSSYPSGKSVLSNEGGELQWTKMGEGSSIKNSLSSTNVSGTGTTISYTYIRNGNTVTGSGKFTVTPSSNGLVEIEFELPIENVASYIVLTGNGSSLTHYGIVKGSDAEKLLFQYMANDTNEQEFHITFTYRMENPS